MGSLLLGSYVRFFDWVIDRLETVINYPEDFFLPHELREIQQLYRSGKSKTEIVKRYPTIHPELVYLLVTKLDNQQGCLDPMDRLFSAVMS
jgi:hypothetical protein